MSEPKPSPQPAPGAHREHHYSPAELALLWGLSEDAIRRLFRHEPGVLVLSNSGSHGKRSYTTLRIPETIARHVHERLSVKRDKGHVYLPTPKLVKQSFMT
jgi:hypothetical protein